MKICLINNLYKPFNRGGAEKVSETIVTGLQNAGNEVVVITTKPYGKNTKYKIYYLNSLYYNLNKLPKFFRLFWHIWNMFNFVSYFKIKKILQKEKCDAVITNNLMGVGYLTTRAIKKLKIKHIHIVHDIQLIHPSGIMYYGEEKIINNYFARIYIRLCNFLFDSPDIVAFPSKWLMDMYLEKTFFIKSKRIILPGPVKIAPLAMVSKPVGVFKFLFLGQIEKHKGIFLLINAFKKILKKYSDSELIIAGNGSRLEQIKIESNIKNIKILGQQNQEQVNDLLQTCDCLVVPALCYENCPAVILEAFSFGLPVLAADLGGISELLSDKAGILFKPSNQVDLADKMDWAIENRKNLSALAEAGQRKVFTFQIENYIKELDELIKL
ncbi:glycosyltransferase [Patescibacteria group bacterium]|nr:glycosyltransferase [Patescibacteria group bacterium]MBU1663379.1 glycosyltransferase [Patescibacteria group bacterium]MBU1934332.1 glycosyltransferase [Patescibacteria group bacterium]MBU2007621.1 glycosyltransferase [Patescibacteria group bacterium]MBU2233370.1 glycosyltransferase [Patescibacteria group bacterium]